MLAAVPTPIRGAGTHVELSVPCHVASLSLHAAGAACHLVLRNGSGTADQLFPKITVAAGTTMHYVFSHLLNCSAGLCLVISADTGGTPEGNATYILSG